MRLSLFLLVIFLGSCSNATIEKELASTKTALATAQSDLQKAKEEIAALQKEEIGQLVHIVLFKVKPDTDMGIMIMEVKKLEAIPEVQDFEVGLFENLGDQRALSDYNLIMEMTFANREAYEKYQKHPTHLALKNNTKQFLAGPPATYDFIEQ